MKRRTAPTGDPALQVLPLRMNSEHRALRAMLSGMAPKRAEAYIRSFELPCDEEYCLLQIDVRRQSYTQLSGAMHVSPEYIKKCRRRAYSKIADAVKNP